VELYLATRNEEEILGCVSFEIQHVLVFQFYRPKNGQYFPHEVIVCVSNEELDIVYDLSVGDEHNLITHTGRQ
jgi:hypothetical protein